MMDPEYRTALEELKERLSVRPLSSHGLAAALRDLSLKFSVYPGDIGDHLGLGGERAILLVRMLLRLDRQLVALWERHGDSISFARLSSLVDTPREAQLHAWNCGSDRTNGVRRGKEKKPGPVKLGRMLASVERGRSAEWIDGARTALRAALGREEWPLALGSLE